MWAPWTLLSEFGYEHSGTVHVAGSSFVHACATMVWIWTIRSVALFEVFEWQAGLLQPRLIVPHPLLIICEIDLYWASAAYKVRLVPFFVHDNYTIPSVVVVVILFSNIIHEQNTSNTNLTNKAHPGYYKHVLCWRPPEKKALAYLTGGSKIM